MNLHAARKGGTHPTQWFETPNSHRHFKAPNLIPASYLGALVMLCLMLSLGWYIVHAPVVHH